MEWLIYLAKVSACLALFYAFYYFFLQRLTFFNANRYYLLATLILSAIIPSLELKVQASAGELNPQSAFSSDSYKGKLDQSRVTYFEPISINEVIENNDVPWMQRIVQAYWTVAIIMFAMFLFQLSRILWYTRRVDQKIGRLKIIHKHQGFSNCSYFNYVFLDQRGMNDEEISQILKHELVHVSGAHSIDMLISGLFKSILWFNPLVYLYDHALQQVHEYEADLQSSSITGNTSYANLLLSIAVKNNPSLVHSFSKGQLKNRITMLFRDQSKGIRKLNYLVAIPLLFMLAWSFGTQKVYATPIEMANNLLSDVMPSDTVDLKAIASDSIPKKGEVFYTKSEPDSLLMVDYNPKGEKPDVYIDGKLYPYDILYKISPRCLSTQGSLNGKLSLTTHDKKIEYATKIDRENRKTRNKAKAMEKFYVRYTLKNQDGSKYDEAMFQTNRGGSGGGISLEKGAKLLFLFDGKQYSEKELSKFNIDDYNNYGLSLSSMDLTGELAAKYGKKYEAKVMLIKPNAEKQEIKPSEPQSALPIDASEAKVSYVATDSTVVDQTNQIVYLYGKAKITFGYFTISADKISYNTKTHSGIAKNVTSVFNSAQNASSGVADSAHFDLRTRTIQSYGLK
ncbi:MAG: hypothetical protein EOO85_12965 [Pedobacter sp.]|nr:MAG: hypothetical protein EOO85_12965 [Pedobacter sp.]